MDFINSPKPNYSFQRGITCLDVSEEYVRSRKNKIFAYKTHRDTIFSREDNIYREILLQDIAKKPNMLIDTAKSEICLVPLQNRVHLLKHTAPNILFIYQICGERRWGK